MSFRRMLPFLLLNIFISAAVVLGILWWWDGRQEDTLAVIQAESGSPASRPLLKGCPCCRGRTHC